jgi:hypothetical protein
MNMRNHALRICLLTASLPALLAQGYSTGFETLTASSTGTPITGQDGYYVPVAGSLDGLVTTYAGNPWGVPANPNGGNNFWAGVSQATLIYARSQRNVTVSTNSRVYVQFDVLCNYVGAATPSNNIGSFSFQPSTTNAYVNIVAAWPAGVTFPPTTWDATFVPGPTSTAAPIAIPDPAFQNLPVGVWHTLGATVDFATGEQIDFRITNGATNVTTVYVPPTSMPVPGQGLPLPTDFRFFAGGSDNLFAIDNFTVTYGATYSTFGAGCSGTLGVPALGAMAGSAPVLGTTFVAQLDNLPLDVGFMMTGFSNTSAVNGTLPLPFSLASSGFPGCDILVDPLVIQLLLGASNSATWNFTIPVANVFAGIELYQQGISHDPAGPGLAFSNGAHCVIGH